MEHPFLEAGSNPLEGVDFCRKVMNLLLKEGTVNRNPQLYRMYWGINTLSVPLGTLFNSQMIRMVLEASDEGKGILAELLDQHQDRLKKYWKDHSTIRKAVHSVKIKHLPPRRGCPRDVRWG